jgi:hypothetical protein
VIELVDPRGATTNKHASQLGRRLGAIPRDAKIGFLSNEPEHVAGPHFGGYIRVLERILAERHGIRHFHREVKPVLSRPATDEMLDQLRRCHGVVNGLAK